MINFKTGLKKTLGSGLKIWPIDLSLYVGSFSCNEMGR